MAISTNHVGWALYKHRVGPRLLTERTEPFGREGTRAHMKVDYLSPKTILNKHAIIPRWKPCDVADWVERLHDFSPERQSVRMSKITNRSLTRSGTGRYIAVPIYGNSGHQRAFTMTVYPIKYNIQGLPLRHQVQGPVRIPHQLWCCRREIPDTVRSLSASAPVSSPSHASALDRTEPLQQIVRKYVLYVFQNPQNSDC